MALYYDPGAEPITKIKVIGIGGGGNNTIDRMIDSKLSGAEFIAINTDMQQLSRSKAQWRIQIGTKSSSGKGCGADPVLGRKAAEESRATLADMLKGTDLVFITAGMGGGTGTGGAPVLAELARELGILTVGVVTKPFKFEGAARARQADAGIKELSKHVDSLVIIPNERLKYVTDEKISFLNAFMFADDVLKQAIASIYELITMDGLISLDFADVEAIMKGSGYAHMGVGRAAGKEKASEAARMAIQSPLLETSIRGAKGVLINIIGSPELELNEVDTAADLVRSNADLQAEVIFGAAIDETLKDEMRITIIASGFASDAPNLLGEKQKNKVASTHDMDGDINAELPIGKSVRPITQQTEEQAISKKSDYDRILEILQGN